MKRFHSPPKISPVQVDGCETQSPCLKEGSSQKRLLLIPSQPQPRFATPIIRKATLNDTWQIYDLYKIVARSNRGNLTQEEDEITLHNVSEVLKKGLTRGLVLVLEKDNQIIGYLKAFTSEFRCLAHVLTNATMMVHPEWQGRGYGSTLMNAYLSEIKSSMPHILRFELLPHQGNQRAIRFYSRHGFVQESLAQKRIRNPNLTFEPEVTMVWFNPNFSEEELNKYHAFISTIATTTANSLLHCSDI